MNSNIEDSILDILDNKGVGVIVAIQQEVKLVVGI